MVNLLRVSFGGNASPNLSKFYKSFFLLPKRSNYGKRCLKWLSPTIPRNSKRFLKIYGTPQNMLCCYSKYTMKTSFPTKQLQQYIMKLINTDTHNVCFILWNPSRVVVCITSAKAVEMQKGKKCQKKIPNELIIFRHGASLVPHCRVPITSSHQFKSCRVKYSHRRWDQWQFCASSYIVWQAFCLCINLQLAVTTFCFC